MRDPFLLFVVLMCIYPLLLWAVPGYLIGRYRLRVRLPITLAEREAGQRMTREEERLEAARIVRREDKDRIGYGPLK